MVVKQQLSKSIKNDISFEKKLHDEVPSGNYKGHHFIYRTVLNKSAICIFYFYILSCKFKARFFNLYGTDKIYKDDLKNQEMVVKQQLSKSIKNDISFEKKLHDEVPSGKNYIIKRINF
jgi:hypothetical protein